jgi:archaellin
MIIVASIAAGVLLRTQGVLQQKALAVGTEARERLVTGVEILSVVGFVNVTEATINQFEVTMRPRAGSSEIQMLTLGLTITTRSTFLPLVAQHTRQASAHTEDITFLDNASHLMSYNMHYDPNDFSSTYISLAVGNQSSDNLSGLNITIISSTGDISESFVFPLGINLSDTTTLVNKTLDLIYENTSDIFSSAYGFISILGYPSGTNQISTAENYTVFTIQSDVDNLCDWENLATDYRYCYRVRLGNQNTLVELGEIVSLRAKMSTEKAVGIDQTVSMQFIPKGGSMEEIIIYVPQVLVRQVQTLWP